MDNGQWTMDNFGVQSLMSVVGQFVGQQLFNLVVLPQAKLPSLSIVHRPLSINEVHRPLI
jgi:hypothetical protein